MPVQLRIDSAELKMQSALKFELVDAGGDAFVCQRREIFLIKLLFKASLQTEGTLF